MNSKYKSILYSLLLLLVILACSPALYIPTLTDSQKTGISADTLALGRKIYVNKCSGCHNLYLPERFTEKQWEDIMPLMQMKADCSDQDIMIITKYLKARYKKD
jgi:cytochrome c5